MAMNLSSTQLLALAITVAFLLATTADAIAASPNPCTTPTTQEISGCAFGDFNLNGLNDQVSPLSGIKVYLYSCDVNGEAAVVDSTVTDAFGNYMFSGVNDGEDYQLVFVNSSTELDYSDGFL